MRILLPATLLALMITAPASAQSVTPFEFYKSKSWTMYQQYWKISFDACVAEHDALEDGRRFTVGRAITGEDFVMVHHMKSLINEGEETLKGNVWINGKTPYEYSGVKPYDSASIAGEKYVTIYLANGFVEQFSKANTVEIEFSKGRSRHSLKGSRDVITRLNDCMDAGLARELEAPPPLPPEMPPLRTPLNWISGTSAEGQGGRYIAIKLPATAQTPALYWAYVESSLGRYDIRMREDEASLASRVDPAADGARRTAVNVLMNGAQAFATLVVFKDKQTDILDVPAADLMKLATAGPLTIHPLDSSMGPDTVLNLTADASFGPGAVTSSAAPEPALVQPAELTLNRLAGKYYARGKNPNGSYYYGTAETVMEGANLRINWKWTTEKTDTAIANLLQNVVTAVVTGLDAPAIYTIGKDGTWRGTWDNGKATEIMVPRQ
jgi:hypothetical protein